MLSTMRRSASRHAKRCLSSQAFPEALPAAATASSSSSSRAAAAAAGTRGASPAGPALLHRRQRLLNSHGAAARSQLLAPSQARHNSSFIKRVLDQVKQDLEKDETHQKLSKEAKDAGGDEAAEDLKKKAGG